MILSPVLLPDGVYKGLWSGHVISFKCIDLSEEIKECYIQDLVIGVRGINIPVTFKIKDNKIDESTIKVKQKRRKKK